jgi:uncharacterized protein YwgA
VNKGQKSAILIDVANELLERGSWCGETHLQKAVFLIQEVLGVETNFEFILYKHGPFSFELRDSINGMVSDGLIEAVIRNSGYGATLLPTADSENFLQRFPKTLLRYGPQIQFVADHIRNRGVNELERLATAVFVINRFDHLRSDEDRAQEIVELKPHISVYDAKEAVQQAVNLIENSSSYRNQTES